MHQKTPGRGSSPATVGSRVSASARPSESKTSSSTDNNFSDEISLVAGLRAGQREAFRFAVGRYSAQMLAAARAIVGPANAEDIVQDAWLTVFKQIDGFEHRAALGTWLQRIVSNRAISHLRAHAREVAPPVAEGSEPDADWFDSAGNWANPPRSWDMASPDDLLTAADLQDCIDKHLQLMPEAQREVIVMRDMQDQGFDEICNSLAVTTSNARVLLHRARLRLMKMVDHFQETGAC
jgi:RNA polymerase sigma-70 factor, ECF subfamily